MLMPLPMARIYRGLSRPRRSLQHRRSGLHPDGIQNQLFQRSDEQRRVPHGWHHPEPLDADFLRLITRLDVNFMQRLDMLRNKRDRHDEHLLYTFLAQALDRSCQRRLQPFRGSDPTLIAKQMRSRPPRVLLRARFANQANRLLNLLRIRISLFHQAHRQPMRAEYQMNARTIRKLPKYRPDALHHRLHVARMVVELSDRAN